MTTEKKQLEIKQVKIGGLRQNCYVRETREASASTVSPYASTIKKYASLEKHQLPNGYTFELEEVDYPINSESVTSYADSSDYRRDPMAAIASAPKRVNLGDIREVQEFVAQSPQEAVRLYQAVGEKLEQYYAQQEAQKGAPAPDDGEKGE